MTRENAKQVLDAVNTLWPHQPWRSGEVDRWIDELAKLAKADVEAALGHFAQVGGSEVAKQDRRRPGLAEMVSKASANAAHRARIAEADRWRTDDWPDPPHETVVRHFDEIRASIGYTSKVKRPAPKSTCPTCQGAGCHVCTWAGQR